MARLRAKEKAFIKSKLEAIDQKQRTGAAARIQARFRGWKAGVSYKRRLATLVELKVTEEKENELRKEQARLLDQRRQQEEADQQAQARADEKALIKRKFEAFEHKRRSVAANTLACWSMRRKRMTQTNGPGQR